MRNVYKVCIYKKWIKCTFPWKWPIFHILRLFQKGLCKMQVRESQCCFIWLSRWNSMNNKVEWHNIRLAKNISARILKRMGAIHCFHALGTVPIHFSEEASSFSKHFPGELLCFWILKGLIQAVSQHGCNSKVNETCGVKDGELLWCSGL